MKVRTLALAAVMAALVMSAAGTAMAQIATTDVHFAKGKTSSVVSGTIKGDQTRDYVVRASEGQTMKVDLTGSNIVFFNVLPPGSNDEAIFVGSNEGNNFAGTLSTSGAYKVRVYQMRATARRGESGNFRLNISVTGAAAATGHGAAAGGLAGIAGMDSIAAIDAMTERGFANVDSLESGNTQYGIFYNRSSRLCAQLTMADGKVLDARDIKTHPKCH
jgi:hypothetical protein